jgi:hypothetical protein
LAASAGRAKQAAKAVTAIRNGLRLGGCARRKQIANERELGRRRLVVAIELCGAIVFGGGETRVDIAEVLARDRPVGGGTNRDLEREPRAVVFAFLRVQDREVVVGLGQLGVVLDQRTEDRDRRIGVPQLGLHDAFEEPGLRLARALRDQRVELRFRRRELPVLDERRHFLQRCVILLARLFGQVAPVLREGGHPSDEQDEREQAKQKRAKVVRHLRRALRRRDCARSGGF